MFNFLSEPYDDDLQCPSGREFHRVLIQENCIEIYRGDLLSAQTGGITKLLPLSEESFTKIFKESALIVIHDCMFVRDSILIITDEFFDHGGMKALEAHFRNGGAILVQCVEGIYRIGEVLSEKFGCRWKLQDIDSGKVEMTERGRRQIFKVTDNATATQPIYLYGKVHYMRSPKGEALVCKRVCTRKEFKEDYYDPDDSDNDEEEQYDRHRRGLEGLHAVCIYEGFGSEGKIIWNGDRGQNKEFKWIFERLLAV